MRIAVVVLALSLVACVRAELVDCQDGRSCPAGKLCDEIHHTCIAAGQTDACDALGEGATCTFEGTDGTCLGGVCFPTECGDGVIEPGEQCDDANRESGDGCSPDCTSNERCGNGVRDPGEACDDGNLISGDGCDSQCVSETLSWAIAECGEPAVIGPQNSAYDTTRHVAVVVSEDLVREWNGSRWSCTPLPPMLAPTTMVYDPVRQRTIVLSQPGGQAQSIWDWNGATWQQYADTDLGTPTTNLVFDTQRAMPALMLTTGRIAHFNAGTGRWEQRTTNLTAGYNLAYDEFHQRFVGLRETAGTLETIVEHSNGIVLAGPSITGTAFRWGYDPDRRTLIVPTYGDLYRWDGNVGNPWVFESTNPQVPRRYLGAVAYEPDLDQVLVLGGTNSANGEVLASIARLTGSNWSVEAATGLVPTTSGQLGAAGFPPRGSAIAISSGGTTYEWRGADWTPIAGVVPGSTSAPLVAYDPVRQQIVAYLPVQTNSPTWAYDGTAWRDLQVPGIPTYVGGIAFDRTRGAIVALANTGLFQLGATAWTMVAPLTGLPAVGPLAFDERTRCLITTGALGSYEQCGNAPWSQILGGSAYTPIELQARGTLFLIDQQSRLVTWERAGANWTQSVGMPVTTSPSFATFLVDDPARAQLLVVSNRGRVQSLAYRSATPRETCETMTDDLDGDELAGCADPDCWWACPPECPPLASCP